MGRPDEPAPASAGARGPPARRGRGRAPWGASSRGHRRLPGPSSTLRAPPPRGSSSQSSSGAPALMHPQLVGQQAMKPARPVDRQQERDRGGARPPSLNGFDEVDRAKGLAEEPALGVRLEPQGSDDLAGGRRRFAHAVMMAESDGMMARLSWTLGCEPAEGRRAAGRNGKPRRQLRGGAFVRKPISRILSLGDHPSGPRVAAGLMRPTRKLRASNPRALPYLVLHRAGLAEPACRQDRW